MDVNRLDRALENWRYQISFSAKHSYNVERWDIYQLCTVSYLIEVADT